MPSFFLLASTSGSQSLGTGQSGFVTEGVTLYTNTSNAVVIAGNATLTAMGTIAADLGGSAVALNSLTDTAQLTVGPAGAFVSTASAAVQGIVNNALFLNNAGLISGATEAIRVSAEAQSGVVSDYHVVNSGRIQSNGDSTTENTIEFNQPSGAIVNIANTGTIVNGGSAGAISIIGGRLDLTNSGTIQCRAINAAITTDLGNDIVSNTGTIIGGLVLNEGSDEVTNNGTITGNILLGNGSDRLVNTGTITGLVSLADSLTSGAISDSVTNSGLIIGDVQLGEGNDIFRSEGGHVSGTVFGGAGNDTYFIDTTDISINDSAGVDAVVASADHAMATGIEELTLTGPAGLRGTGSAGNNTITGGAGDDTIRGGDGDDNLIGQAGDDRLFGGRGNDSIRASDDDDMARGGAGNDVIFVVSGDATLDGGNGTDTLSLVSIPTTPAVVNLATGTGGGDTIGTWTISGFENIAGGAGAETLIGDAADNIISGGLGADSIVGGNGNDTLTGDGQADTLTGGKGDDVFVFTTQFDSTAAAPDLITDFSAARDLIDLALINANGSTDSAFTFLGSGAFTAGSNGEVRFVVDAGAGTTSVEIRLGNAAVANIFINLTGTVALTEDNFIL